ncbi:MAG: glycosyltransferase family 39 protein [Anaerolineaceae bacterium]|nr:glycosyltransferase family 39 protein [Anaerolineaceae bacterium]
MPDWMTATLASIPALLWIYFGLGIPWALAVLPRRDWRNRVLVLALAFALGPALLTAWMFLLGSLETPLLRFDLILAGTVVLAITGAALAWHRKNSLPGTNPDTEINRDSGLKPTASTKNEFSRWGRDEKLLLALIGIALVIRWVVVAYWPFTAYDALWVYGYEGRLYTTLGHIPSSIGYYPQFLPLQFTYAQLAVGGISDHAARAVLPFLHLGSILAAYVLGERLVNRRTGLFAAAIWALYPHVGEWSRFGDLEIPLTFLFTLSAAFFLMAWTGESYRRRYALIAGVALGIGMWTKPTMGAFIWGVALLVALELARVRFDWRAWLPRFRVAVWAGIASIPLGAVWYVRNILNGHNAIDLPPGYWLTQAARSGVEFGWPLLALIGGLLFAYMILARSRTAHFRREMTAALLGLTFILAGVLPSILGSGSLNVVENRMKLPEWLAVAAGAILLGAALWQVLQRYSTPYARTLTGKITWALLLALPYFVTWFYSYSYHYRLSFPIVPLLILPTAALLAHGFSVERVASWRLVPQLLFGAVLVALSVPGIVAPLSDPNAGSDWLWTDKLPDDIAKYRSGNEALLAVVEGLQIYKGDHPGEILHVVAPGVDRLPFFFPGDDIRIHTAPTRLSELEGVDFFVYGTPETRGAYENIPPQENQVVGALGLANTGFRTSPVRQAWSRDDGIFRYEVFELHVENRFLNPQESLHDPAVPVIFGDVIRFRGHGIGGDTFWPGRPIFLQLYWESLVPATEDYMVYIHLRDREDNIVASWDGPATNTGDGRYYSTLVWEPGEFIIDERKLRLPDDMVINPYEAITYSTYRLVVGFYSLSTESRLAVAIDGQPAGDGFTLDERILLLPAPPS